MTGLREAVRQNASWCVRVCDEHGVATTDDGRLLVTAGPPPPFFPHAMTLDPAVPAAQVAAAVAGRQECGVKDSFAVLDLSDAGFTVLFRASWLVLDVDARDRAGAMPPGPDVVALGSAVAGSVAHRCDGVIGLQDVVTGGDPRLLTDLVAAARERLGVLPVVGYEHGPDLGTALAAGFREVGPLRVWVR